MSQRASSSSGGNSRFTFVSGNSHSEARSHAMREHWKKRHKRNQEAKSKSEHKGRASRTLLPRSMNGDSSTPNTNDPPVRREHVVEKREKDTSIPAQLLGGMGFALSSSRPDPFQTCPVHLTSQHQKLLHHWISTHAAMMFEDLEATKFNPMKDVWFPLDLSNASSFHCIMAHSAAHLAQLYASTPPRRGTNSSDALKYKMEAVRILRLWLADPEKELSDDSFAAVVRLLTFERYWGSAEDWKIHRDGLQLMIDAKGGIGALHENWRLQLVVYLVSLMTRPSWLESTNNIEQITRSSFSSPIQTSGSSLDIQKVRCLWLISFIQDMRTFMRSFYTAELIFFPSIHAAVGLLRDKFQVSVEASPQGSPVSECADEIPGCLFSLGVLLQESISPQFDGDFTAPAASNTLEELETFLRDSQDMWSDSVHNLSTALYQNLAQLFVDGDSKINYVMDLVQVLGTLSLEARQGVEKCLLNLLYCLGNNCSTVLVDDGWTPDSLLSSMHGH